MDQIYLYVNHSSDHYMIGSYYGNSLSTVFYQDNSSSTFVCFYF